MPLTQVAVHGPVQRLVVSPGREEEGIAHLAGGQASNPLVPYFGRGHDHWLNGTRNSFLPAQSRYELHLAPARRDCESQMASLKVPTKGGLRLTGAAFNGGTSTRSEFLARQRASH